MNTFKVALAMLLSFIYFSAPSVYAQTESKKIEQPYEKLTDEEKNKANSDLIEEVEEVLDQMDITILPKPSEFKKLYKETFSEELSFGGDFRYTWYYAYYNLVRPKRQSLSGEAILNILAPVRWKTSK